MLRKCNTNINNINSVLVIGAGTMGHSIAQVYAQAGFEVSLVDLNQEVLEHAFSLIKLNLDTLAEYGRINSGEIPAILDRIRLTTDLQSVASEANIVVEAVNENPEVKKNLFLQLDKLCSKNTIFASNTSGLNIFKIVETQKPERLVIHHFCYPAYIIPLVEIVAGPKTSPEIIDISVKLMEKLGKKPIVLKEYVDNFIINRFQSVINVQAYEMMQKGWATAEQIDFALKTSLGIRLPIAGVVQTQDFNGLDLILDVQKRYGINRRYPIVEKLVKEGYLGAKTGKGFYDYGGHNEEEIIKKRDILYLKMLDFLEKVDAFEPI